MLSCFTATAVRALPTTGICVCWCDAVVAVVVDIIVGVVDIRWPSSTFHNPWKLLPAADRYQAWIPLRGKRIYYQKGYANFTSFFSQSYGTAFSTRFMLRAVQYPMPTACTLCKNIKQLLEELVTKNALSCAPGKKKAYGTNIFDVYFVSNTFVHAHNGAWTWRRHPSTWSSCVAATVVIELCIYTALLIFFLLLKFFVRL